MNRRFWLCAMITAILPLAGWSLAQAQPVSKPTLFLIGDSTVKNSAGTGEGGLWGWGKYLWEHFDTTRLYVENRALGGTTGRSFMNRGLWTNILADMKPGDFLFLQFGHNEGGSPSSGRSRSGTRGNGEDTLHVTLPNGEKEIVHSYGWYLREFVRQAGEKGVRTCILSLIPRNSWTNGKINRADADFGLWARQAAEQSGADFIDLNKITCDKYDRMGEATVRATMFPATDRLHTNREGAIENARSVIEGLRALPAHPLHAYLKQP